MAVRSKQFVGVAFISIAGNETKAFRAVTGATVTATAEQVLTIYSDFRDGDCMPDALQTDVIDRFYQQFVA